MERVVVVYMVTVPLLSPTNRVSPVRLVKRVKREGRRKRRRDYLLHQMPGRWGRG